MHSQCEQSSVLWKTQDTLMHYMHVAGKKQSKKKAEKFLNQDHTDSNMLVAIRIRPLNQREVSINDMDIIRSEDKLLIVLDKIELEYENEGKKPEVLHRSKEQRYYFDRIFPQGTATETVYRNTCEGLISSVIQGYNGCVFAYGTTGSGKTYTMAGTPEEPGIMFLIIKSMFEKIQNVADKKIEIKVTFVEIYNEVIRDLLVSNSKDTFLDLRDDPEKGVQLSGVTEFQVQEPSQVMSLLQIGNKRRTTESTNANQTSSRSHAIFQIQLSVNNKLRNTENEVLCGKLSLIDLAGSERGTVTENRGIRLREGAKINTSLLALANCINALGDKTKKGFFVPFRDSKLTRMLKDSLGGNCQTVMIATISPASSQNEETINTLKYANRAKNIKMRVEPNKKMVYLHISAYKSIIADLRDEIDKLKAQLSSDLQTKSHPNLMKTSQDIELIQQRAELEESKQNILSQASGELVAIDNNCSCDSRLKDQEEKRLIMTEISEAYEEIIQLEQALIELDEQNTMNALEIRKREAKVFIAQRQCEDMIEEQKNTKENLGDENINGENGIQSELNYLQRSAQQQQEQIEILNESTKQNLLKRQSMKQQLYENYQQIKLIRSSIDTRIVNSDIRDYLELVIKNNFLESQNVQLLLNLQLQARTIIDLKNMIAKQQKFIEDNDITTAEDKNIDIFLEGAELDGDDVEQNDDQYASDMNIDEKQQLGIQGEGIGPQSQQMRSNPKKIQSASQGGNKKPINLVTQQHQQHQKRQSQANTNQATATQQPGGGNLSIVGSGVKKTK